MTSNDDEERRQFGEYFHARRDVVRRTAYLLCGDWYWADDLAQVAFSRLAAGWRRIRDRGALDGFVHTCLVRAYLSDLRRVWRRRERSVAVLPDAPWCTTARRTLPAALSSPRRCAGFRRDSGRYWSAGTTRGWT